MARPARPDDADEEILEHGIHFRYLVIGDGGQLYSSPEAPPEAPAKIVVDADSFLLGELRREQVGTQRRREGGFEFIGVRTGDGLVFRVVPIGHMTPGDRVFPDA